MTDLWIDTAEDTTSQIQHLLADNVVGVIRYLTENAASEKCIKPAEAKALGAAGIRLALVFETGGGAPGQAPLSAVAGARDAAFVLQYVPTLGAPNTLCIPFAADNDFNASQIQSQVLPYFRAISTVFAAPPKVAPSGYPLTAALGYKVGAYGSGAVCQATHAAGYASYTWLSGSMGWTGSRAYLAAKPPELILVQDVEDTRLANMGVDTDYALGEVSIFSYLPFAPAPVVAAPAVAEINPSWLDDIKNKIL